MPQQQFDAYLTLILSFDAYQPKSRQGNRVASQGVFLSGLTIPNTAAVFPKKCHAILFQAVSFLTKHQRTLHH